MADPYFELHGDRFAASVALNLEHVGENEDDAVLGLHKTGKRHVVHTCLEDKEVVSLL